jgi:hypothetical protein
VRIYNKEIAPNQYLIYHRGVTFPTYISYIENNEEETISQLKQVEPEDLPIKILIQEVKEDILDYTKNNLDYKEALLEKIESYEFPNTGYLKHKLCKTFESKNVPKVLEELLELVVVLDEQLPDVESFLECIKYFYFEFVKE